jgi:hypothetical protein
MANFSLLFCKIVRQQRKETSQQVHTTQHFELIETQICFVNTGRQQSFVK